MPLLDIDPLSGSVEHMQYDHSTKSLVITREQNIDFALAQNDWAYNEASKPWRGDNGDMWHVASVPETIVWAWLLEFNESRPFADRLRSPFDKSAEWDRFQWARLNSSDYRKLKTAPVHV